MNKQKTIKYFTLAMAMIFLISACGGGSSKTNNDLECDSNYSKVYAITGAHPSASISSNSNRILIRELCQNNKDLKDLLSKDVGSFIDNKYRVYYSSNDKPAYGHNVLDYYSGTQYNGLSERYMYASSSKSEFITKIKNDIENNSCKRWAANYSGGLRSSNNFWTYFCPQKELIGSLE